MCSQSNSQEEKKSHFFRFPNGERPIFLQERIIFFPKHDLKNPSGIRKSTRPETMGNTRLFLIMRAKETTFFEKEREKKNIRVQISIPLVSITVIPRV
jgi:hypothetical protein